MATEAQIRANRLNAERSTGPRTNAGKDRSRLNATKHGLSAVLSAPEQASAAALAEALNGEGELRLLSEDRQAFAEPTLQICRVHEERRRLLKKLERAPNPPSACAFARLNRYERRAVSARAKLLVRAGQIGRTKPISEAEAPKDDRPVSPQPLLASRFQPSLQIMSDRSSSDWFPTPEESNPMRAAQAGMKPAMVIDDAVMRWGAF